MVYRGVCRPTGQMPGPRGGDLADHSQARYHSIGCQRDVQLSWMMRHLAILALNERSCDGVPARKPFPSKPMLKEVRKTTPNQRADHRSFFEQTLCPIFGKVGSPGACKTPLITGEAAC